MWAVLALHQQEGYFSDFLSPQPNTQQGTIMGQIELPSIRLGKTGERVRVALGTSTSEGQQTERPA